MQKNCPISQVTAAQHRPQRANERLSGLAQEALQAKTFDIAAARQRSQQKSQQKALRLNNLKTWALDNLPHQKRFYRGLHTQLPKGQLEWTISLLLAIISRPRYAKHANFPWVRNTRDQKNYDSHGCDKILQSSPLGIFAISPNFGGDSCC